MRAVIQRVLESDVVVDNKEVGKISKGLMVLLGVGAGDTLKDLDYIFDKTINLRIFEDEEEKMNLSLMDIKGELLVISQFTLYGDVRKGRRPSFSTAAQPDIANDMYKEFIAKAKERGIKVNTGKFGADMKVSLVNDGPVTILLDSSKLF